MLRYFPPEWGLTRMFQQPKICVGPSDRLPTRLAAEAPLFRAGTKLQSKRFPLGNRSRRVRFIVSGPSGIRRTGHPTTYRQPLFLIFQFTLETSIGFSLN